METRKEKKICFDEQLRSNSIVLTLCSNTMCQVVNYLFSTLNRTSVHIAHICQMFDTDACFHQVLAMYGCPSL